MGSFSWMKANKVTKDEYPNVVYGKPFKFLIPVEFGGGFIIDDYQDYGKLGVKEDGSPRYDMYELQAFWNHELVLSKLEEFKTHPIFCEEDVFESTLQYDGAFPLMKEINDNTRHNRSIGISLACYNAEIDELQFPLKLVSVDYTGTYEDCENRSYGDPEQGCIWGKFYETEEDDEEDF